MTANQHIYCPRSSGLIFPSLFYLSLSVCLLIFISCPIPSHGDEQKIQDTARTIFQQTITLKPPLNDLPIRPVLQQSELVGYVFQSIDFVDLRGFSGKPINLLIGIDPNGSFKGVQVLEHHEPMFNHDLVGAMQRFVDQYRGLNVTDEVIIDNSGREHSDHQIKSGKDGPILFDGISKATISLSVINRTVLSSALHVARSKLEAYKQQKMVIARDDVYEQLNWQQLLSSELIKKWTITQKRVERATGLYLEEYSDPNLNLNQPNLDLDIYYGYLNTPVIGKNLLGEKGFDRLRNQLKPGEHAFAVMSEGFYSYLGHDFSPGTETARLFFEQHGLRIALQDMDFFSGKHNKKLPDAPEKDHLHIFKTSPTSELLPNEPMEITLNMVLGLPNGKMIEARFQDDYSLPANLFQWAAPAPIKASQAVWVGMWESKLVEISILCLALATLTITFIKQQAVSRQSRAFHRFRWAFLFFTLFFIGFYAQGQLSVINVYTLLLEIWKGFDINFFLLDPIIFILWVYTFTSLFLWGRGLFCGWLCPFGALQEMLAWVANKLRLKQIRISQPLNKHLITTKYIIFSLLVITAFYSAELSEKLSEVEPFKTSMTFYFIRSWPFVVYVLLILGLGMFVHKFYCRFVCPLGAGLAILGRLRRYEWLSRRRECGSPCQVCRHRCGINAIDQKGQIDYNECIQCLECIVIINDNKQCAPAMVAAKKSGHDQPRPFNPIQIQMQIQIQIQQIG